MRELTETEAIERNEPKWIVSFQDGFEQTHIAVYGDGLCETDAEEAALEFLARDPSTERDSAVSIVITEPTQPAEDEWDAQIKADAEAGRLDSIAPTAEELAHSVPIGQCRKIAVGMRVQAGEGEDFDRGRVDEINGGMATVSWDSLVVTPCPLALLTPEAR